MLLNPTNREDPNSAFVSTYVGLTVETFKREGVRVMSDIWATCLYAVNYNPETGAFEEVRVVSYFELDDCRKDAKVDASPEILAKYAAWKADNAAKAAAAERARAKSVALAALKTPVRGRDVTVVKGRKLPLGTTGRVFWIGNSGFGPSVGIEKLDGSRVFTAAKNVEAVVPADKLAALDADYGVAA